MRWIPVGLAGTAVVLAVAGGGCYVRTKSSNPNVRMQELLRSSEDLHQVQEEWKQVWKTDQPYHLTGEPINRFAEPEETAPPEGGAAAAPPSLPPVAAAEKAAALAAELAEAQVASPSPAPLPPVPAKVRPSGSDDKLDRILERLDRLEQRLDALEKDNTQPPPGRKGQGTTP